MSLSRATVIECDYVLCAHGELYTLGNVDWAYGTREESRQYFEAHGWIYTADVQSPRCKTYCSKACQRKAEKEDK